MHRVIAVGLAFLSISARASAQPCTPSCRAGEQCQAGRCAAACAPPCAEGATCTPDGCSPGATAWIDPSRPAAQAIGPVPVCEGRDPRAAEDARERGRDLYRRAVSNAAAPDPVLMAAALREFDRQCAAGDDMALELRASALLVLGRHVEAARTIDAFLRLHPAATLPADLRTRLEGNLPLFTAHVGSIRVLTNAPNALARIGEAPPEPLDGRLLRVEPGVARISVWAPGAASPVLRAIAVRAGETVEARFVLEPAHPARNPVAPERARPAGSSVVVPSDPPERPSPEPAAASEVYLAPWAVTAGVVGGLLLAGGGVATGISFERADYYELEGCPENPSMPGCEGVLDEFDLAGTLRTAFFIAGGVLAAASVALVVIDVAIGDGEPEEALRCTPLGPEPAIACRARF